MNPLEFSSVLGASSLPNSELIYIESIMNVMGNQPLLVGLDFGIATGNKLKKKSTLKGNG